MPSGLSVPAVVFDKVSIAFDGHAVLSELSFSVPQGRMLILLGASGSGKSVVLKLILGLLRPDAGTIVVNGERIERMSERDLLRVRADIGMLFQESALFDSLTVGENVGYRLYEEMDMPESEVSARVAEVLGFVGLDPITSTSIGQEIVKLRDLERVTSVVVTHQIRDAFYIASHRAERTDGVVRVVAEAAAERAEFMVLHEGRIDFAGTGAELLASDRPYLRKFLAMTLPPW